MEQEITKEKYNELIKDNEYLRNDLDLQRISRLPFQ